MSWTLSGSARLPYGVKLILLSRRNYNVQFNHNTNEVAEIAHIEHRLLSLGAFKFTGLEMVPVGAS